MRSLFILHKWMHLPSRCCRSEVEECTVTFHLICAHTFPILREERTECVGLLIHSLHNFLWCKFSSFFFLLNSCNSVNPNACLFFWIYFSGRGSVKDNKDRGWLGARGINIWARCRSPPPPPLYTSHST